MATAYLCVAQGPGGFNKLQVLKYLRPDLAADEEFLKMFLEEARIAARINHPNVVQTNEIGFDGICHYIAMEYVEGQTLENVIRRAKKRGTGIPLDMHLRILADALGGLHHAHELLDFDGTPLNIVHRDVSPHNIMVTYDGFVKVLDFGIAKAADSSSDTRSGMLKGKYAYMAPEQYSGDRVDRRADIFATGVMIWQAITGLRMWKGITGTEIIARVIKGDIKRPSEIIPDVDPKLEAICMKALSREPEGRYATAIDLQNAIEEYLRARSVILSSREVGQYVADLAVESRSRIRAAVESQLAKSSATEHTSAEIPVLWLSNPDASRSGEVPPHTTTASNSGPPEAMPTTVKAKRGGRTVLVGAAGLGALVLCFAAVAFWPTRAHTGGGPVAGAVGAPTVAPEAKPSATESTGATAASSAGAPAVSTATAPSSATAPSAAAVAAARPAPVAPVVVGGRPYGRVAPPPRPANPTIPNPTERTSPGPAATPKPKTSDIEEIGGRE
jgi:serine/threonine-protein kinase